MNSHSSFETKPVVARGKAIDLRESAWQIFHIMSEFVEGYQFLSKFSHQVTIFGSARTKPNSPYYKETVRLGELLAKGGYSVITGGGPGIMEAANKGAFEAGGMSIGLNIHLPQEQTLNQYVRESRAYDYFLTRKVMLTTPSQCFICCPGGFGTLDEMFEVLDQMRYKQLHVAPVILLGRSYWEPLLGFLKANVFERIHALESADLSMISIVDSAEEAFEIVKKTKPQDQVCSLDASEFCSDDAVNWRIFRIMAELVEGFEFLRDIGDVVTILGTPRVKLESRFYKDAYQLAQMLGKKRVGVVTGGGDGTMEAANKGAYDAGAGSYGLNMLIDERIRGNAFITKQRSFHFPYTRKLMLTTPSRGFVLFPGGYGTLNLCFELMTLIQTGKIRKNPIILYGADFWEPLLDFIQHNQFEMEHTIAAEDLNLFKIVDTPKDAMSALGF